MQREARTESVFGQASCWWSRFASGTALRCSQRSGAGELAAQTLSASLEQPRRVSSRCALRAPTSLLRSSAPPRRPAKYRLSPSCAPLDAGDVGFACDGLTLKLRQSKGPCLSRPNNLRVPRAGRKRVEVASGRAPWGRRAAQGSPAFGRTVNMKPGQMPPQPPTCGSTAKAPTLSTANQKQKSGKPKMQKRPVRPTTHRSSRHEERHAMKI